MSRQKIHDTRRAHSRSCQTEIKEGPQMTPARETPNSPAVAPRGCNAALDRGRCLGFNKYLLRADYVLKVWIFEHFVRGGLTDGSQ